MAKRRRRPVLFRGPSDAQHDRFEHPLAARYASPQMAAIFSPQRRYATWRRAWIALAEAQRALGLAISHRQIAAMSAVADQIDFASAARHERQTRHDVMAHIHAFGDAAPIARGVIHLGATSMDIVDNADLLLTRDALDLLLARLSSAARSLRDFCKKHADLPTLGFTHLQPAQLTTVGKRAALWLEELAQDAERLLAIRAALKLRGLRGATGTQASFLKLLGTPAKVARLETLFVRKLGFRAAYPVCGQTCSRKVDVEIVFALAALGAGAQRICNDIRVLALLKEVEEPFEKSQVGSSAMPYKRNPALCERATGLGRYLVSLASSPAMTLAAQFLERTLDDSSNKRLVLPEAFLAADAVLILLTHIFSGLVVYPGAIRARIDAELPFIATENILMEAARAGGDRQQLHERIRAHAQAAGEQVKRHARKNDLIERLRADGAFSHLPWRAVLDPREYVGLAPRQTRDYLRQRINPLLKRLGRAAPDAEISV